MSAFTMMVIMGVLLIIGGISLAATPLITFISAGYYVVFLFFAWGIYGIFEGVSKKRYNKNFYFAILSLVLGIIGLVYPGAVAMSNYVIIYMAAAWFFVRGIMTILDTLESKKQGAETGAVVLGICMGVLEIIVAVYSVIYPATLAVSIGMLIGFYFVESGVELIVTGSKVCEGANNVTVLFTVMGILTIIGGLAMLVTPLLTFVSTGFCIIMLFFFNGIMGIIRAIAEKKYDKEFALAIVSLLFGIIGFAVPGVAAMNNSILLTLAAIWFLVHGAMVVIKAINSKKEGATTGTVVLGVVLGVLELLIGAYSLAHPMVLAVSLGILISFYFIESGVSMIFVGSELSKAVASARANTARR